MLHFLRDVFDFSRPGILELEVLDLLVEEKPLLLVSFAFKRQYTVKIHQTVRRYRLKEGAVIAKLARGTDVARIDIRNKWRSRTISVRLKKTKLDDPALAMLINELHPMHVPAVFPFPLQFNHIDPILTIPSIRMILSNLALKIPNMSIHQEQLTYVCNEQGVL